MIRPLLYGDFSLLYDVLDGQNQYTERGRLKV